MKIFKQIGINSFRLIESRYNRLDADVDREDFDFHEQIKDLGFEVKNVATFPRDKRFYVYSPVEDYEYYVKHKQFPKYKRSLMWSISKGTLTYEISIRNDQAGEDEYPYQTAKTLEFPASNEGLEQLNKILHKS